jgi:hypothetical protein
MAVNNEIGCEIKRSASNDWLTVNNELRKKLKDAVMSQLQVLQRHIPQGTQENPPKNPQSG